jgi:hypothetical protein
MPEVSSNSDSAPEPPPRAPGRVPRMTKTWRYTAWGLGTLGFLAVAIRLVTTQYVVTDSGCPAAAQVGSCFHPVAVDPATTLLLALFNGVLWFAIVWAIFQIITAIRKRGQR